MMLKVKKGFLLRRLGDEFMVVAIGEVSKYFNGMIRLMNSTPFVRQYGILNNKWGVLLCQKGYQTNAIHQNSRSRL